MFDAERRNIYGSHEKQLHHPKMVYAYDIQ